MDFSADTNLVRVLKHWVNDRPNDRAFTFLVDGEQREQPLTYAELDRNARAIAVKLAAVVSPGARAILLYPPGLEYITAFFGCLYAGVVAVPAYPPDPARIARTLPRLQAISADAQAEVVLTTAPILMLAEALFAQAPDLGALRWIATDEPDPRDADAWQAPAIGPDTLAFLQYTSGSTGNPKGVMLTHGNLVENERMIQRGFGHEVGTVVVGWLPQYHDMGLIGNLMQPVFVGGHSIFMSPMAFLQRPMRWLRAIHHYRATTSGGPNFAYDLCVRKSTPEDRAALDLSCWKVAFTGAEPVRADTLDRFVETFGAAGFARATFYPCYGLAEASLIVTGGTRDALPQVRIVDAQALAQREVVPAHPQRGRGERFVGCGAQLRDERVCVVDPETRQALPDGRVGEIWVRGGNVSQGYWNQPALNAETFDQHLATGEGGFLRTGDLGFLADGELFVTGRIKDLIIIRGRNVYPQDVELTVERSNAGLRPGCGAAFAVDVKGEEKLVCVHEIDKKVDPTALDGVVEEIRRVVVERHDVRPSAVVLIPAGAIPKTTSGKIQRRACREAFLDGTLEPLHAWGVPAAELVAQALATESGRHPALTPTT